MPVYKTAVRRLTDEAGALSSPALGSHILRTLTDDPHRPHITDGSPCWCGTTALGPYGYHIDSAEIDRRAAAQLERDAADNRPCHMSADEARAVAAELALLAKVREAWAAYKDALRGLLAAQAAPALYREADEAVLFALDRLLSP